MPKLYHRKSTQGCLRCKKRRVKCDEEKPICRACRRHNVSCEYPSGSDPGSNEQRASTSQQSARLGESSTSYASPSLESRVPEGLSATTPPVELRLFQHWLVQTCSSFSIAADYWRFRVPLIASDYRYVFDGILALSALHLHRQTDGDTQIGLAHQAKENQIDVELFLAGNSSQDMLGLSTHYLHCAIRGHRTAYESITSSNAEAVYLSAVLITLNATFLLSADDSLDNITAPFDESMWLRLAVGPRELVPLWQTFVHEGHPLALTGALKDGPDLSDNVGLFRVEYAKPFEMLLSWASEFEYVGPEDYDAYEKTLSFLGLAYKMINEALEEPLATSRRVLAFPARVPPRFQELALEKRPRALVIIAHVFATMKLLAEHIPFWVGIAEKHIPSIERRLPVGWKPAMKWPKAVLDTVDGSSAPIPIPPTIDEL